MVVNKQKILLFSLLKKEVFNFISEIKTSYLSLCPDKTTEENLLTVTATVDQVDPLRAICKNGKIMGKIKG